RRHAGVVHRAAQRDRQRGAARQGDRAKAGGTGHRGAPHDPAGIRRIRRRRSGKIRPGDPAGQHPDRELSGDRIDVMRRPGWMFAALLIALHVFAPPAGAQDYPTRSITLIVPFPAGGGVDAMGRIVAERLPAALGQQVIVDNRGGAAGVIGTRAAAKMAGDGYTLVMATSGTTTINPSLHANPGYAPLKDFVPIGLVAETPIVIM